MGPKSYKLSGVRLKKSRTRRQLPFSIYGHSEQGLHILIVIGCLKVPLLSKRKWNCSSQPSIVHWLRSPIFPCLVVWLFGRCPAMVTSDQICIFFNIYRHKSPTLTKFHLIPSSTKLYWPSTTKYQPVPTHTDSVPPSNNQYSMWTWGAPRAWNSIL